MFVESVLIVIAIIFVSMVMVIEIKRTKKIDMFLKKTEIIVAQKTVILIITKRLQAILQKHPHPSITTKDMGFIIQEVAKEFLYKTTIIEEEKWDDE